MNRIWIAFFLLFLISPVRAEETIRLEEVVITASKIQEPAEETTSSVTIIKEDEIKKMEVEFVSDVLRTIPGLMIRQNGGAGTQTTAFLRGGNPSHTLVMVDGIKVNSSTTGSFDFAGISVDDIERIEIVKGPQSTIYGSEAMAGVINIITKKGGGKTKIEASAEAGSFGTYKPSLTISGGREQYDYRITGLYFHSDGISTASAGEERDSYDNSYISGKVSIRPAETFDIELTGNHYYDRIELDDFDFFGRMAIDNLNFIQRGHHSIFSAKARLYLLNKWEQVLTGSVFDEKLGFADPFISFNNADIRTSTQTLDWQNNLYLTDSYTLTAGIEYRNEHGENVGQFDSEIENKAAYLNNRLKLFNESLILNAGLRHDEHETFGSKTTYKIGAVYAIKNADMRLRGSYGTGFRAPKFNELYFPFYGNPDLEPEESHEWEIGVEKDFFKKRLYLSLTYFDQSYKNLIETDPLSFTAANISRSEISGVEAEVSYKLTDSIRLAAGYTYLDAEDEETGQNLPFRPKNRVTASAEYFLNNYSVSAQYVFVSRRFDSLVQRDLDSYSLVNLSGSYSLTKQLSIFARINNLFDTNYEEVGSFNTPGFSVFGGLKITYM